MTQVAETTSNVPNKSKTAEFKLGISRVDPNDLRSVARKGSWHNRFDPVYLFLDYIIFDQLFRPPKKKIPGAYEKVTTADADFLLENLNKHRIVLWFNIVAAIFLWLGGLKATLTFGDQGVIVTGLLAPAMVTGGAWYAVSFGGIPEKYIGTALRLTFCMYLAFSLSMTLLTALLIALTPWPVGWFILFPMYASLYIASMLYDNLDGLKIGLDTSLLKYSRAALNYYQKKGFVTGRDTETDIFEETSEAPDRLALFTHQMNMLERNMAQLERRPPLPLANHLIASSIDILFRIIEMGSPREIDKGEDYDEYVAAASRMEQAPVDAKTVIYIRLAISALREALGPAANNELEAVEKALQAFTNVQARVNTELGDEGVGSGKIGQELADHLFAQAFEQLLSLLSAHRHVLLQRRER